MPKDAAVKCIECAKWSPKRASQEWAKMGFGHCERREAFVVHAGETPRECEFYAPAEAADIQARRDYAAKHRRGAE